jgi:hypothetical protein
MDIKTKFDIEDSVWYAHGIERSCECCGGGWVTRKVLVVKATISYITVRVNAVSDVETEYDVTWNNSLNEECGNDDIPESQIFKTKKECEKFAKTFKINKLCQNCRDYISKL